MIFVVGVLPFLLFKWFGFLSLVGGLILIFFLVPGISIDLGLSRGSGLSSSYVGGPSTNSRSARLFLLFLVITSISVNFMLILLIHYGLWVYSVLFLPFVLGGLIAFKKK
jgi:hypothetical protein